MPMLVLDTMINLKSKMYIWEFYYNNVPVYQNMKIVYHVVVEQYL